MKYTNEELKKMIKHGNKEIVNFRIFLYSYNGDNKDDLIKRYKEATLALDVLKQLFDGASKEGVIYYLDKIRKLEPFIDDITN